MPDLCNRIYSQLKDAEIEILLELFPEFNYSLKWYKDKEEELNARIEFDCKNTHTYIQFVALCLIHLCSTEPFSRRSTGR